MFASLKLFDTWLHFCLAFQAMSCQVHNVELIHVKGGTDLVFSARGSFICALGRISSGCEVHLFRLRSKGVFRNATEKA